MSPDLPFSTRQRGFTLVEILVSVLILAFGLLGIGAMLGLTLKSNSSSFLKQLAVQSAYNITERLRANRDMALAGHYNLNNLVTSGTPLLPATPTPDCSATPCTPTELASYDRWDWLVHEVAARLPAGCASVTAVAEASNLRVTVTLQWDDRPAQSLLGVSTSAGVVGQAQLARLVSETLL